jgi:hypothetical protein
MKLAKIVLPALDNEGRDLFEQHRELQAMLIDLFGGFTSHEGLGGWKDAHRKLYHERVIVYEVAMERASAPELRDIALVMARSARQQSVMIVTPNGDVEFVHPAREKISAASS